MMNFSCPRCGCNWFSSSPKDKYPLGARVYKCKGCGWHGEKQQCFKNLVEAKVFADPEIPATIYLLPSEHPGKTIQVVEDPIELNAYLISEDKVYQIRAKYS